MLITTSWDDGHPADARLADLLAEHGVAGTFYIPNRNSEGRPVLPATRLREIAQRFEIGGHGSDHLTLTELLAQEAYTQIVENKTDLENIVGHPIEGFCYIRGRHNRAVRDMVHRAGYSYARTIASFHHLNSKSPYMLPTTIQFYPHKKLVYCSNFARAPLSIGRARLFFGAVTSAGLVSRIDRLFAISHRTGTYFHLWGHSWEIEEHNLWAQLAEVLKYLAAQPDVKLVTNSAVVQQLTHVLRCTQQEASPEEEVRAVALRQTPSDSVRQTNEKKTNRSLDQLRKVLKRPVVKVRAVVEANATLKRNLAYVWYRRESAAKLFGSGRSPNAEPVVFTTQKSASVFVKTAIRIVAEACHKRPYDYEGFYWNIQDDLAGEAVQADASRLFAHKAAIYGPFRDFVELPRLSERPTVLMLRDPRDVLVSAYFSRAYSHTLPGSTAARREFLAKRKIALEMSLDEHVLYAVEEYLPKYSQYADRLLPLRNVSCLTYEDMFADFRNWAVQFIRGLGGSPTNVLVATLLRAYEAGAPSAAEEALSKHRRQAVPGEYARKLQPSTIDQLNNRFGPVMRRFGVWNI